MGKPRKTSANCPATDGPTADEALQLVKELADTIRKLRIDEAIRFFNEAENLPEIQEIIAAHDKQIAEEIGSMTHEVIFRYGEYNIDRVDRNPVINASLNLSRVVRNVLDEILRRQPKADENRNAEVIRLREENKVPFKKIGKCLIELNPAWSKNGKPYTESRCKNIYGRAKKRKLS